MHSILVYHTINKTDGPTACAETISPERFEDQLRWLSRRRRVVSLEETLIRSPKDSVVAITFDDGYRDNLTIALPLLEKYSLPMTLFVVAGFVDSDGYLSEEELREMARHPLVTIGSHGLSHPNFTLLATDEARLELKESKQRLQEIIGRKVDLLAWPYGECNPELERLSGACGYRASWSVWKGTNGAHSRWRVPLGGRDHMIRFIAKSSGLYALTEARLHRAKAGRYSVPVTAATDSAPMTTTV
ncbi:MAG: polysaccharide deacetylase family protein [Pyrinomonadaceae bacterium]